MARDHFIKSPTWVAQPTGADYADDYPSHALKAGIEGHSTMTCSVTSDGALTACRIIKETPPGQGFGPAELKIAAKFRMQPTTSDGRPVGGGQVMIPVLWKVDADLPASPSH